MRKDRAANKKSAVDSISRLRKVTAGLGALARGAAEAPASPCLRHLSCQSSQDDETTHEDCR